MIDGFYRWSVWTGGRVNRTPPQQPAAAQPAPPPRTLPITGSAPPLPLFGAGLLFVAAGWLVRRRTM